MSLIRLSRQRNSASVSHDKLWQATLDALDNNRCPNDQIMRLS
jgi:hypothetical protein